MTGAEFLAYVKRKFKRTDKDTEIYEAATDTIADMRLQIVSERYKEEAYLSGIDVLGEYRLAVPSDFGHMIGDVSITETGNDEYYKPLEKISKLKYDELYGDRLLTNVSNVSTGVPKHFCVYGDQIFLGPVPDLTTYRYQINYTTEGYDEVAADTDPVPFTTKYRNILRAGVLSEVHDGLESYEESNYWRAIYTTGLRKIMDNDDSNISDSELVRYSGV